MIHNYRLLSNKAACIPDHSKCYYPTYMVISFEIQTIIRSLPTMANTLLSAKCFVVTSIAWVGQQFQYSYRLICRFLLSAKHWHAAKTHTVNFSGLEHTQDKQ